MGYLPLQGGTYLGCRGTYLGQGITTLAWGGVSTLAMGIPSLVGWVLTLTGGTYLNWGSYICLDVLGLSNVKISQVVKKMSNYQKDVKCQKVKHLDYGGGSQKK